MPSALMPWKMIASHKLVVFLVKGGKELGQRDKGRWVLRNVLQRNNYSTMILCSRCWRQLRMPKFNWHTLCQWNNLNQSGSNFYLWALWPRSTEFNFFTFSPWRRAVCLKRPSAGLVCKLAETTSTDWLRTSLAGNLLRNRTHRQSVDTHTCLLSWTVTNPHAHVVQRSFDTSQYCVRSHVGIIFATVLWPSVSAYIMHSTLWTDEQ